MSSVGGIASAGELAPIRRIAVLRPNHRLGNTLLLSPLLQELERLFPQAHIELVTACADAASLFQRSARVSAAYTFPSRSYRHPLRVLGTMLALRRERFDLAIDPVPRQRAGRFLLQFVRARDRLGFHWGVALRDIWVTHRVDASGAPEHVALAPLYLLRTGYLAQSTPLQVAGAAPAPPLDLRLTESERRAGRERLQSAFGASNGHGPQVGLFVHATGEKGYPISWWRELIEALRREVPGIQLLEVIPADRRPRLATELPGLHTQDLRLLAATLAATSLLVIPDGGVMHLAEAAGARVLGLFRQAAPARYAPYRVGSQGLWAREITAASVAERIRAMLNTAQEPQGPPAYVVSQH